MGLALRTYAIDQDDRFPWQVSRNQGGANNVELNPGETYWQFHMVRRELENPRVLRCPSDGAKVEARVFGTNTFAGPGVFPGPAGVATFSSNTNLSCFAGINADGDRPVDILTGDRNLSLDGSTLLMACISAPRSPRSHARTPFTVMPATSRLRMAVFSR